jgi:hypothetical protein
MATSPQGPAEQVGRVEDRSHDECDEQASDLVAGEGYESVPCAGAGVFIRADDSQEGVREHGERDPARPGRMAADLVLVQGGQTPAGMEELLHPPPRSSDSHQRGQRDLYG